MMIFKGFLSFAVFLISISSFAQDLGSDPSYGEVKKVYQDMALSRHSTIDSLSKLETHWENVAQIGDSGLEDIEDQIMSLPLASRCLSEALHLIQSIVKNLTHYSWARSLGLGGTLYAVAVKWQTGSLFEKLELIESKKQNRE